MNVVTLQYCVTEKCNLMFLYDLLCTSYYSQHCLQQQIH